MGRITDEFGIQKGDNEMDRETIINALMQDYGEYLEDFTLEELELISINGVFTLREAQKQERADRGL